MDGTGAPDGSAGVADTSVDGPGTTEELSSDPRVQSALDRLTGLDDLDVSEHVAVYDAVHRDLRDALAGEPNRDLAVPE